MRLEKQLRRRPLMLRLGASLTRRSEKSTPVVGSNLVGWWELDEGSGTTVYDSKTSATGTITSANPWPTPNAGVWINRSALGAAGIDLGTLYLWANGESKSFVSVVNCYDSPQSDGNYHYYFGRGGLVGVQLTANYALRMGMGVDELEFYYRDVTNNFWDVYTTTDANIPDEGYAMYTVVYTMGTGSTFKIYKNDGVLLNGSWTSREGNDAPLTVADAAMHSYLGGIILSAVDNLWGFCGSYMVYDKLLSQTEIQQNYAAMAERFTFA